MLDAIKRALGYKGSGNWVIFSKVDIECELCNGDGKCIHCKGDGKCTYCNGKTDRLLPCLCSEIGECNGCNGTGKCQCPRSII